MKKGETGTKTTGIWRLICLENFTFSLIWTRNKQKKATTKNKLKVQKSRNTTTDKFVLAGKH